MLGQQAEAQPGAQWTQYNQQQYNGQQGNSQQHNQQRYKTRMCAYANGNCPYQARGRCFFAHSEEELRNQGSQQQNAAPPKMDLSKRKTRMCQYFLAGNCPYTATNSCLFAHSEQERQSALYYNQQQQQQQQQQPSAVGAQQQGYATSPYVQPQQQQQYDYSQYVQQYTAYAQQQQQHQSIDPATAAQQMYLQQQQQYQQALQQYQQQTAMQQWTGPAPQQQQEQWAAYYAAQEQPQTTAPTHSVISNPANQQQRSQVYHKTRLCKFGDACPYKEAGMCRFAHSMDELRSGPSHSSQNNTSSGQIFSAHEASRAESSSQQQQQQHLEEEKQQPATNDYNHIYGQSTSDEIISKDDGLKDHKEIGIEEEDQRSAPRAKQSEAADFMRAVIDGPGKPIVESYLDAEIDLQIFHLVLNLLPRNKAFVEERLRKAAEAPVHVD